MHVRFLRRAPGQVDCAGESRVTLCGQSVRGGGGKDWGPPSLPQLVGHQTLKHFFSTCFDPPEAVCSSEPHNRCDLPDLHLLFPALILSITADLTTRGHRSMLVGRHLPPSHLSLLSLLTPISWFYVKKLRLLTFSSVPRFVQTLDSVCPLVSADCYCR